MCHKASSIFYLFLLRVKLESGAGLCSAGALFHSPWMSETNKGCIVNCNSARKSLQGLLKRCKRTVILGFPVDYGGVKQGNR